MVSRPKARGRMRSSVVVVRREAVVLHQGKKKGIVKSQKVDFLISFRM